MSLINEFKNMSDFTIPSKECLTHSEETLVDNILSGNNTILYGPPGTGKTYTALAKIDSLKKSNLVGEVLVLQFHPQYTYQDFIEGYKFDGNSFKYKKGVFLDFCDSSIKDKFNIIYIDEINRADLSSVFGELLYLLDRDENKKVFLPLSGIEFSLPKNIIIVGSMNSADKSILLIDFALRRRFDFIFIPPSIEGFNSLASQKNIDDNFDFNKYKRFFQVINSRILRHPLLGKNMTLGHSMFFSKNKIISYETVYKAVVSSILPQIEAYFGAENYSEISKILNPDIAKNIMYGNSISIEDIRRLIDIVSTSQEEVIF